MTRAIHKEISLYPALAYALLINAGATCLWPITTIYMHDYLHKSLEVSGLVLFVMALFMILGNYLGGYLFDHWSPYKTALISTTIIIIATITLVFFHGWPAFGILILFIGLGDGANITLINSYASKITNYSTEYVFNALYIGFNLGVVLGTAISAYLLQYGIQLVFAVSALFYIILFFITILNFNIPISYLRRKLTTTVKVDKRKTNIPVLAIFICLLIFFIYLSYVLWDSVIPVRMTQMNISFSKYSLLWTINGLMIVFGQPFINKIWHRVPLIVPVSLGIGIFGISFFGLIFVTNYLGYIIVMVILSIGEINGFPGLPVLMNRLAPNGQQGKYQGLFNMSKSFGQAVGPFIAGIVVERFSYPLLYITAGILVLISLFLVVVNERKYNKKYESEQIS